MSCLRLECPCLGGSASAGPLPCAVRLGAAARCQRLHTGVGRCCRFPLAEDGAVLMLHLQSYGFFAALGQLWRGILWIHTLSP